VLKRTPVPSSGANHCRGRRRLAQALGLIPVDSQALSISNPVLVLLILLALPLLMAMAMLARPFMRPRDPVTRSAEDVAKMIERFLDGPIGPYDWDKFCNEVIADPYLDSIRARCAALPRESPPTESGHYCGESGVTIMREYVAGLRSMRPN
jgi:hypothetical protein